MISVLGKYILQFHANTICICRQQIYPDEAHSLSGVIKHEHRTMEAFLDDTFGPIEDFFEDDYLRAAVELLQKVEQVAR